MKERPSGKRLLFLSVLSAASAYTADISIFPTVLASLSKEFELNASNIVLLAYSYNMALVVGIIPSYFGRTPHILLTLFRLGLVLFSAGAVLLSASDTFYGLLYARILMGLGAGIFSPLIPSIISVMYKEKTKYLSYWATTTGAVCVIAPLALIVAAQFSGLRSSVVLIAILSILAFFLVGRSSGAPTKNSLTKAVKSTAGSLIGLLSVLVTVFIIYGQVTWLIYSVPFGAAHGGSSDTYLALLGVSPWISFTIVCYAMGRVSSVYFPQCLMVSAILAGAGLIVFINLPTGSIVGPFLVMFVAGTTMAIANIPSTALAFSYVDSSRFGLISCFDILAARLGGAFYLYQFDWALPGAGILWSGIPLVLSLGFILRPRRCPVSR